MVIIKALLLAFGLSYILAKILSACGVSEVTAGLTTAWFLLISIPAMAFKMQDQSIKCVDAYKVSIKFLAVMAAVTVVGGFFAFILKGLLGPLI